MGTVTLAARILLALVFAVAGATKLFSPAATRSTFEGFGVAERYARIGGALLAPAEVLVALGLVFVATARGAAIGAAVLLLVFIGGITNALREGRRPDCGCFGALHPTPIGRETLVRNVALLLVAAVVIASAPGPAIDSWLMHRSAGALLLAALIVVAGVVAVIYPTAAPGSTAQAPLTMGSPPLLSVGQAAPSFERPDTDGRARTLDSLYAPGLPLVVAFGSATCGSCLKLFPLLARWQRTLGERLVIALVLGADIDAARAIATEHDLAVVLADPEGEVARAFGIPASPAAVALTADGRVQCGPAIGPDAVEDLIRLTLHRDEPIPTSWTPKSYAA